MIADLFNPKQIEARKCLNRKQTLQTGDRLTDTPNDEGNEVPSPLPHQLKDVNAGGDRE